MRQHDHLCDSPIPASLSVLYGGVCEFMWCYWFRLGEQLKGIVYKRDPLVCFQCFKLKLDTIFETCFKMSCQPGKAVALFTKGVVHLKTFVYIMQANNLTVLRHM